MVLILLTAADVLPLGMRTILAVQLLETASLLLVECL